MIETRAPRHIPVLDGVRGLAILLVVFHNVGGVERDTTNTVMKLINVFHMVGWVGVQLFFVLSGFLITGILLDSKDSPRYFRSFYMRRSLRIFPLYYAALIAYLVVAHVVAPTAAWSVAALPNQVYWWTYLCNWVIPFGIDMHGLSHFWSLAVEEQFYFVWPVVVLASTPRTLALTCVALFVVSFASRVFIRAYDLPEMAAYAFTVSRMDALAVGALIALVIRNEAWLATLRAHFRSGLWLVLVPLVALAAMTHGLARADVRVQTVGYGLLSLAFGALVFHVVDGVPGRWTRALSRSPMRALGKYSYGWYVLHVPMHTWTSWRFEDAVNSGSTLRRVALFIAYVGTVGGLSFVAALGSWHLLERRALDLKRYFAP